MNATVTGFTLDLRAAGSGRAQVAAFASKRAALAALAALRTRGHNVDPAIECHRAETHLARFWVLGLPDHFHGITYLMTAAGAWVAGRLTDAAPCFCAAPCRDGHAAPWSALPRDLTPATFTHVTRTVADSANRRERYKTKSNGSCGRFVWSDDSVAVCTCPWRGYGQTREEARAAARRHLAEVAGGVR